MGVNTVLVPEIGSCWEWWVDETERNSVYLTYFEWVYNLRSMSENILKIS